jgi:alkylation response protein AidB-like acyl-CoA dehydrogenase
MRDHATAWNGKWPSGRLATRTAGRPMTIATKFADASAVLAGIDDVVRKLDEDVAARERDRVLPHNSIKVLRASGVLSLRVPIKHGGVGGTIRQQMEAIIEIASVDSNVAQGVRPHFFFIEDLWTHGFGETPARWWPKLAAGTIVGNALSESTTKRVGDIASTVRRQRDGSWLLNGTKSYSTGALFADLLYVVAEDEAKVKRRALIPIDRSGITLNDDWDGMGQRTTATGTTSFRDVVVFDEEILEMTTLDQGFSHIGGHRQLFLSAILAGIAANASRDVNAYIRDRARPSAHSLAATAAEDPYVLRTAGDVSSSAFAARAVVLAAADSLDRAADRRGDEAAALSAAIDVARAQSSVGDLVLPSVARIFDAGGASAVRDDVNLHRHWRNARTVLAHNPLDYKRRAVGDWEINGREPPRTNYF